MVVLGVGSSDWVVTEPLMKGVFFCAAGHQEAGTDVGGVSVLPQGCCARPQSRLSGVPLLLACWANDRIILTSKKMKAHQ